EAAAHRGTAALTLGHQRAELPLVVRLQGLQVRTDGRLLDLQSLLSGLELSLERGLGGIRVPLGLLLPGQLHQLLLLLAEELLLLRPGPVDLFMKTLDSTPIHSQLFDQALVTTDHPVDRADPIDKLRESVRGDDQLQV